jgi:hypothetical protein
MADVYEGAPDGRQGDAAQPVSRFRPRYRALFDQVKAGRYRSLGITALEEAVMWTVKELTS